MIGQNWQGEVCSTKSTKLAIGQSERDSSPKTLLQICPCIVCIVAKCECENAMCWRDRPVGKCQCE